MKKETTPNSRSSARTSSVTRIATTTSQEARHATRKTQKDALFVRFTATKTAHIKDSGNCAIISSKGMYMGLVVARIACIRKKHPLVFIRRGHVI